MLTSEFVRRVCLLAAGADTPSEGELWDVDRLERHGRYLAETSGAIMDTQRLDLTSRLKRNAQALESSYEAVVAALQAGRAITPAAEWLVDNFHVVTEQLSDIPLRLTIKVWRTLPAANHPDRIGWPRVLHIAMEYLRHTLWEFNPEWLTRMLAGYQDHSQLKMQELWALYPIMRIALIDELRRIAVRVEDSLAARSAADMTADSLLYGDWQEDTGPDLIVPLRVEGRYIAPYIVQLAHRLQGMGERGRPVLDELSAELARCGTSIDDFIQRQHARRSASNLAARNVITSLRVLASFNWRSLFEKSSQVELLLCTHSTYTACDRRTRDRYRACIEELSTVTSRDEHAIAQQALDLLGGESATDALKADLGSWLIGSHRHELESALQYSPTGIQRLKRWAIRHSHGLYLGGLAVLTLALTAIAVDLGAEWRAMPPVSLLALILFALLPISEVALGFVNRQWLRAFPPRHLPRLALESGLDPEMKTLVVVPTILRSVADAANSCRQLHVHSLANPDPHMYFALLSDWADSATESAPEDEAILDEARREIATLNAQSADPAGGPKYFLLHRRRQWNEGERCFMGWERKRGKLEELNNLLLDRGPTTFLTYGEGEPVLPAGIRYVLTVDADTRIPLGSAKDLVGIAAHPLNKPMISVAERRVVQGYGVLQPRITPLLPGIEERSLYREIVTSGSGVDPYAAAVSDLNQDVFDEGLFTGKGLYDVRAWDAALGARVPPNALLSHDLFEGLFARCGLVTDIELFEDFPSHSEVAAARSHRWIRGDWQLLPWILGRRGPLPPLGRWKMLDNLRRSLVAPFSVALLVASIAIDDAHSWIWLVVVLGPWLWPAISNAFGRLIRTPEARSRRIHLRSLVADVGEDLLRAAVSLALLAQNAWLSVDAIARALFRMLVSHRRLLEWVTAAQLKAGRGAALSSFAWPLRSASIVVVAAVAALVLTKAPSVALAAPLLALWWLSPLVAQFLSRPLDAVDREEQLPEAVADELRGVARLTWTFFERFVTAEDNFLPPDNFQEDPVPVVAHRSSPTNFGLYLLATVSARDFGWLGLKDMAQRLTATFSTLHSLERFDGHFLNWYDTKTLHPLSPQYVSTVDSGNLAGNLLALRQACLEIQRGPLLSPRAFTGPLDAVGHCRSALVAPGPVGLEQAGMRAQLFTQLQQVQSLLSTEPTTLAEARDKLQGASHLIDDLIGLVPETMPEGVRRWLKVARQDIASHLRDLGNIGAAESTLPTGTTLFRLASIKGDPGQCSVLVANLEQLAQQCQAMVAAMSFGFLFDRTRALFSIGFRVADRTLDSGYYDLLASEARLASLVAIAKGDVPRSHWFRLGRRLTGGSRRPVLASWSGSMFEYLMPALVMNEPRRSLLEQTNGRAVQLQIEYGADHDLPWGISESAYNVRDREFTYQYSGFGLPSLGLKRGLASDYVVAPYASALAAMYEPVEAYRNLRALARASGQGFYGFYEALDYTAERIPEGKSVAVVRAYMAHHQGMSLVALNNVLQDRIMQRRFHAEPSVTAADLLLQERAIRFVEAPALVEADVPASQGLEEAIEVSRTVEGHNSPTPVTHLLSNRNYSVMITDSGGGYSSCRTRAVTRWREDATQDGWGSFFYLYDLDSRRLWSAGFQPTAAVPDEYRVHMNEESVMVERHDGPLRTTMEVVVATGDDGELRRITLQNNSGRPRIVEVTSFAEVVLAPQRADIAHPGFSNLFVQTEFIPESGALLATRRPRSDREAPVWALHVIAGTGDPAAYLQYETDRARFLGRGNSARTPEVIQDARPLSNTVGNVLDPVFSLRTRVVVPAKGSASVTFATFVTTSRELALALVEKYRTPALFEHVSEAAWTFARAELYYLQSSLGEAMLFQALASHLIIPTPQLRASEARAASNTLDVTHLWRFSVSGDRPILLIRCHSQDELGFIQQILRAQEYLRIKRLVIDVIILNERRHSYAQDLQQDIERIARAFTSHGTEGEDRGGIYPLALAAVNEAEQALLLSTARVVLDPAQGSLAEMLRRPPVARSAWPLRPPTEAPLAPEIGIPPDEKQQGQEFFNGWGGFVDAGREYHVSLQQDTPMPWSNVLANEQFGSLVTERGSMCTWSLNSRENQLTAWSNDAICDPSGEAFYLIDEDDEMWSPAAQPIRRQGAKYNVVHGQGYSQFDVSWQDLASSLTVFVAADDPVKLCRLRLTNQSSEPRRFVVISYVEWALGATRSTPGQTIRTRIDPKTGAQFASNPALVDFGDRVAFCDLGGRQQFSTDSRHEFLGRNGFTATPGGARSFTEWTERSGQGFDPCCAFAVIVSLEPGESDELLFVLGQAANETEARELLVKYRESKPEEALEQVRERWNRMLGTIQIQTPDRALDLLFNRWLLYQATSCRVWGRAAFYQAGGAFGFRDQLQDGMALTLSAPEKVRAHLLRSASRQFVEGDVQHWWHPPSGRGVRTHFSDDRVWLPFAVHQYIQSTGDAGVLREVVPFIEGPPLPQEQEDAHYVPTLSDKKATLFEHCARALDISMRVGVHGLPLMGSGDWNDGMNRVGHEGRGESVWLAWFLITTLRQFVPFAVAHGDRDRARRWRDGIDRLARACEVEAWDGRWYRRAFFDDGTPLGSALNAECRIDSLAQSWAVLSEAADPARVRMAMASVREHLVRRDEGLVLLFDPPFDATPLDPGYIKGYLPGLRENGGQFTHAAIWVLMAQAALQDHRGVAELLRMLNPIRRSATRDGAQTYRVEPYVLASDIYSGGTLAERGGWTWYTGAAGWFYRAILEYVLGLKISADTLKITPCVPPDWKTFQVSIRLPQVEYEVQMRRVVAGEEGVLLDGVRLAGDSVPLLRDGLRHVVQLCIQ